MIFPLIQDFADALAAMPRDHPRFHILRLLDEAIRRVQTFELQYLDGQEWKVLASGTRIGHQKQLTFPPVTAQHVRLNILQAAKSPSIAEFQLFAPATGDR